jgi:hypothetical protein
LGVERILFAPAFKPGLFIKKPMADNILQETALALKSDWGLQLPDTLTEEEILKLLAEKIVPIIQKGPDAFYQLMYRLDISEKKLMAILHEKDVADKIARLIYDRQLQKIRSRQAHRNQQHNDITDPDLKW